MKGLRKLILGIAFLGSGTFIAYTGIKEHTDMIGIGTVIGAIGAGLLTIVWGNTKEHEAAAATGKPGAAVPPAEA